MNAIKNSTEKFVILHKNVGQTPLECVELWRKTRPDLNDSPLAYAGRLDPMASGKLLILIGDECKNQENYHSLDKEYVFEILFGLSSDSGDVLGLINEVGQKVIAESNINNFLPTLVGVIELPYPIFSSRTVNGKPLHTWALEGRLEEITIPTKKSEIYSLKMTEYRIISRAEVVAYATNKIELIPKVTDLRKALGNDFRRPDIRKSWAEISKSGSLSEHFSVAKISCLSSSGTYMRTLAEVISSRLGTSGLAYSIDRTEIGLFDKEARGWKTKL